MMEKVDLKRGAAFYSKTEVNLKSTNSSELFSKNERNCFGIFSKISKDNEVIEDFVQFVVWIFIP